jgi:hypothetical protein
VALVALTVGLLAGPADAKSTRMSAKQKAHIRAQLRRAVKKNPRVVQRKSFLKKASLVDFTLPITVKLRYSGNGTPQGAGNNPNNATLDLGASLGKREIDLGGSLAGEIQFHDSFDGGALGNVDLVLDPPGSGGKYLTTTSIPLLWNQNTYSAGTAWDAGLGSANALEGGCANFIGNSNLLFHVLSPAATYPGVPVFGGLAGAGNADGRFIGVSPGIDDVTNLTASKIPGNINSLGGQVAPFPSAPQGPGTGIPDVKDTVLRTAPLKLGIATPGTVAPGVGGAEGTQNVTIGKSGGQANLFGNIPGKSYGIDVTVSLATQINSIIRAVDVDAQHIDVGSAWPAALFNCRQAVTGSVPNYIPDVHLKGSLKISPAITPSGDLRIAKASLSSLSEPYPTHVALAACLSPWSVLAAEQNGSDGSPLTVPDPIALGVPLGGTLASSYYPADTSSYGRITSNTNPDFSDAGTCDSSQTQLTQDAGFSGLGTAQAAQGYSAFSTSTDGSKVSVAGDITVNDVEADIIIGDR